MIGMAEYISEAISSGRNTRNSKDLRYLKKLGFKGLTSEFEHMDFRDATELNDDELTELLEFVESENWSGIRKKWCRKGVFHWGRMSDSGRYYIFIVTEEYLFELVYGKVGDTLEDIFQYRVTYGEYHHADDNIGMGKMADRIIELTGI